MTQDPGIAGLFPAGVPLPDFPYSPGVRAGDWVFVSGQMATDFSTGLAPEVAALNPLTRDGLEVQSRFALQSIAKVVSEAGGDLRTDAVRIYQWFTDPKTTLAHFEANDFHPKFKLPGYVRALYESIDEPRPASTGMAMFEQLVDGSLVQIDVACLLDGKAREGFAAPEGLPVPVVKYSPALRQGDFVFLAGEMPTDFVGDFKRADRRGDGSGLADEASANPFFWYESPVAAQTEYTLWKQSRMAEAAGTSLSRAIKAEVYLAEPSDYAEFELVWKKWFPENPPARSVIPYMGMASREGRVEIAFWLLSGDSELEIETIETLDAPPPLGHEPQAVKVGDLLFLSTQYPIDSSGNLAPGLAPIPGLPFFSEPGRDEMRYMRRNIAAIAAAAGTSIDNAVRVLSVYDDLAHFASANDEWTSHIDGVAAATSAIGLVGGTMLVPGSHLQLDVTIYAP